MRGEFREERLLLVPAQRIRLALVGIRQQLDAGCALDPGESMLVHPLALGEVQNAPHDLETVIDRSGGSALLSSVFDPRLECAPVDALQRQRPDPGHELLQQADVAVERTLVLILADEPDRRFLEAPLGPDTVDPRLTERLRQSGEVPLGLRQLSRSSALANSLPLDPLVDVP